MITLYCIWSYKKSAAVLVAWLLLWIKWMRDLESQKKITNSNPHLLCTIASLNWNFINEYIICYCLHPATVSNHFNITLFSISFPVFNCRLITHSWPTHQQCSIHSYSQTGILSPSQQLHNSSNKEALYNGTAAEGSWPGLFSCVSTTLLWGKKWK